MLAGGNGQGDRGHGSTLSLPPQAHPGLALSPRNSPTLPTSPALTPNYQLSFPLLSKPSYLISPLLLKQPDLGIGAGGEFWVSPRLLYALFLLAS